MAGATVVYLVWPPLGLGPLERFAASYREHPAGTVHRLVVALKGLPDGEVAARSRELAHELDAEHLLLPPVGLDLDTYHAVAAQLAGDCLCLFNSSSAILADGWLRSLTDALSGPSVGLVGATGSYESPLSAAPRPLRPLLQRRYAAFPNPHIRTNAFMLGRDLLLDLDWPRAGRKHRARELESGSRSITRQVLGRGLRALVVDRHARCHEPEQWPTSLTFRRGDQENLLVADNRTRQYDEADPARRANWRVRRGASGAVRLPRPAERARVIAADAVPAEIARPPPGARAQLGSAPLELSTRSSAAAMLAHARGSAYSTASPPTSGSEEQLDGHDGAPAAIASSTGSPKPSPSDG